MEQQIKMPSQGLKKADIRPRQVALWLVSLPYNHRLSPLCGHQLPQAAVDLAQYDLFFERDVKPSKLVYDLRIILTKPDKEKVLEWTGNCKRNVHLIQMKH